MRPEAQRKGSDSPCPPQGATAEPQFQPETGGGEAVPATHGGAQYQRFRQGSQMNPGRSSGMIGTVAQLSPPLQPPRAPQIPQDKQSSQTHVMTQGASACLSLLPHIPCTSPLFCACGSDPCSSLMSPMLGHSPVSVTRMGLCEQGLEEYPLLPILCRIWPQHVLNVIR